MAAALRGTVFMLLLLSFITQGFHSFEVFHQEYVKVVVGQKVSLPCILKKKEGASTSISQIEWRKKGEPEDHRLVVYHPTFGESRNADNVRLILEKDGQNKTTGSSLIMEAVEKVDSGRYICEITAYPNGSIRKVTRLMVKDLDDIVKCNSSRTIEAAVGQKVTVNCTGDGFWNITYRWTKDNKRISDEASLVLWSLSENQAGVYTLTVTIDNTDIVWKMEFNMIMLSSTTKMDKAVRITNTQSDKEHTTYTPPLNVTLNTWFSSTGSNISGPTDTSVNITRPSGPSTRVTSETTEPGRGTSTRVTSETTEPGRGTSTRVTSETTEPGRGTSTNITTETLSPFSRQEVNSTFSMTTPVITQINTTADKESEERSSTHSPIGVSSTDQSGSTYPPTVQSNESTPWSIQSNGGQGNSSKAEPPSLQNLPVTTILFPKKSTLAGLKETSGTTMSPDSNGQGVIIEKDGSQRSVMVWAIFPFLALLILVAFLYRRHTIQKRMDMPPPFKPPPPPVKFSLIRSEDLPLTDILI